MVTLKGFAYDKFGNPVVNAAVTTALASDAGFGATVSSTTTDSNGMWTTSPADATYDVKIVHSVTGEIAYLKGNSAPPMAVGTGQLAANAVTPAKLALPTCQVSRAAAKLATAVSYTIDWDTEEIDTDAMWTVGSATRITVPNTGRYQISGCLHPSGTSGNTATLEIEKNGGTTLHFVSTQIPSGSIAYLDFCFQWSLTAADYLEFHLTSAANIGMQYGASAQHNFVTVMQLD